MYIQYNICIYIYIYIYIIYIYIYTHIHTLCITHIYIYIYIIAPPRAGQLVGLPSDGIGLPGLSEILGGRTWPRLLREAKAACRSL